MFKSNRKDTLNGNHHNNDDSIRSNYYKFHNGLLPSSVSVSTPITTLNTPTTPTTNAFPKEKHQIYKKFEGKSNNHDTKILFDKKLRTVLICTVIALIVYKIITFSLPHTKTTKLESLSELQSYILKRMEDVLSPLFSSSADTSETSTNTQSTHGKLLSLLCGIGFAIFSWIIVYLDSNLPGIHPPSPLTPKSKLRHWQQKSSSFHLGYMTAIASGIVVSCLMYFDF